MTTQSKTILRTPARSTWKPLMALVASLTMVFSFAVPAQAAVPVITSFTPAIGTTDTVVTLTGTGYSEAPVTISFGTVAVAAGNIVVNSATEIEVKVPAGSGQVDIIVTTAGGSVTSATKFTYQPTITALSATTGPLGGTNSVVITGTTFVGVTAVTFGGTNATSYTVNSATQITAVAPARAAGAVNVVVTATGGTATRTSGYTYVSSPPTITSIGTRSGPLTGATTVVITGTNFHGVVGSAAVKFGANNATSYTVNSTTQITAVAPAGVAGTVNVVVTAVDGTATLGSAYTYRATSTAVNASERIFFSPGRSEIRSSQYEAFAAIALATEGKTGIRVVVTSRRWSGSASSLGKARNTSVIRLLELLGLEGANVTYTRFNTKATAGGSLADKNNRVSIAVTWTN